MSRKNRKATDSHPWNFSTVDLQDMARERDRWLDFTSPLDFLSVDVVRRAQNEATRGAYAQLQWLWEQLEPADPILATCVERRLGALKRIPWDIRKKDGLSDAEDLLAEAQLRTVQDFANAIENLDEGIEALAQASFRHYRHIQLLETEAGALRLNLTENWNWARDGYAGAWQWNPAATYGLTRGMPLPVDPASIVTRICARPIDQPAMMLCLDRKNAKAQWLVYNGRYGTPPVFAIMPQGVDESLRKEYIKFAMQCVSNAAGVLPAGADVKTVTPGNGGPDTFSRMIDLSTQELVLRATGGLMTMLTAPGAGTNTATGSAHQDAFDDLAASEAEQIANLLQEKLFAPVLEQWHPGQPHLVEFVMKRPDSDNAAGSVQNIVSLATSGYRTPDEQVAELTGLQVSTDTQSMQQPGMVMPPALNSLRVRYAPTMLYPPARAAFERAINNKAMEPGFGGTESRSVYAEATALPSSRGYAEAGPSSRGYAEAGPSSRGYAEAGRNSEQSEPPLTGGELAALRALGGEPDATQLAADAGYVAEELRKAVRPAYSGDVAQMTASNGSLLDALLATNAGPGGENCQARSAETCRCHPSSWKPITMPKSIKPQEARERLAKSVRVKNPLGEDVTLNNELLKHWEKAGKSEGMINDRLSALPLIEEVVKNPAEIWENNNGSRTYLASVIDPYRQNGKSYTVAFTQEKDNTVLETYHLNSNNAAGKRKGKQLYP